MSERRALRSRLARRLVALDRTRKAAILIWVNLAAVLLAWALLRAVLPGRAPQAELASLLLTVPPATALLGLHRIKLRRYLLQAVPRSLCLALICGPALALLPGATAPLAPLVLLPPLALALIVTGHLLLLRLARTAHALAAPRDRLLIWGAGRAGRQLAAALATGDSPLCAGFLDDDPRKQGQRLLGLPVHAPSRAADLLARHAIPLVVLALPPPAQPGARAALSATGCEVTTLPGFAARLWGGAAPPPDLLRLLGRVQLDPQLPQVRDSYAGARILVTGAGGSIGAELCRQLLRLAPARLVLLDQSELALYTILEELEADCPGASACLHPVLGSVCDPALLAELLTAERIDTIFHAAALKHLPLVQDNPLEGIRTNVLGTRTLAEAAQAAGVARMLLISTDKAVRPTSTMGASKRLAEEVMQDLASRSPATRFAMVRFGNVLGSSGSVVPRFAAQIARGGPVTVTHPEVTRYFMTCAEAVRLTLLAGAWARGGDLFVLDMGPPQRILDLACRMIRGAGRMPQLPEGMTPPEAEPPGDAPRIEVRFTGLRPGEKLAEELLTGEGLRPTPHPRILRAREPHLSQIEIAAALTELRRTLEARDSQAATEALHRWVARGQSPRRQVRGQEG